MRGKLHSETVNTKAPSTLFTSQEQTATNNRNWLLVSLKQRRCTMKLGKRVKMSEEYRNAEPDQKEIRFSKLVTCWHKRKEAGMSSRKGGGT